MSIDYDGGPAFPRPHSECSATDCISSQEGMTLRDYFAAQALVGAMSGDTLSALTRTFGGSTVSGLARCAYELADAMLAERERKPDGS